MGDHGMDPRGDHGGDSKQEMDAGLFFYSKKPFYHNQTRFDRILGQILNSVQSLDDGYELFSRWEGYRTVQQIDLVPTLGQLLGLGIPFGNLGTVIPEFFIDSHADGENLDEWMCLIESI